jgi:hypothetical protein
MTNRSILAATALSVSLIFTHTAVPVGACFVRDPASEAPNAATDQEIVTMYSKYRHFESESRKLGGSILPRDSIKSLRETIIARSRLIARIEELTQLAKRDPATSKESHPIEDKFEPKSVRSPEIWEYCGNALLWTEGLLNGPQFKNINVGVTATLEGVKLRDLAALEKAIKNEIIKSEDVRVLANLLQCEQALEADWIQDLEKIELEMTNLRTKIDLAMDARTQQGRQLLNLQ